MIPAKLYVSDHRIVRLENLIKVTFGQNHGFSRPRHQPRNRVREYLREAMRDVDELYKPRECEVTEWHSQIAVGGGRSGRAEAGLKVSNKAVQGKEAVKSYIK
jgi:hypothetical protein